MTEPTVAAKHRTRANRATAAAAVLAAFLLLQGPTATIATTTAVDQEQRITEQMYCITDEPIYDCAAGRSQMVLTGMSGALVAVEIYMGRQSTMSEDVVIEIRDGYVDDPLLATSDPVAAVDLPILPDAGWVRFYFPEPPFFTVRDVYSIVVPTVSQGGTADWAWGGAIFDPDEDPYPNGAAWSCNEYNTCVLNGHDMAFVTYVEDVAPAPTVAPTAAPPAAPTAAPVATSTPTATPAATPTSTASPRPTPTASPSPTPTATVSPTPSPSELTAELVSGEGDRRSSGFVLGVLAAIAALVAIASFGGRAWLLRRQRLTSAGRNAPRS